MAPGLLRALNDRRLAIRVVAIGTVVGLVVRLTFALVYWEGKPITHDEREYLLLARSLAAGQGLRYPPPESQETEIERFGRAPFYPFVLSRIGGPAILNSDPSTVPRPVKIGQSLIGAAGIPVLAAIAWRAAGPAAGAAAALVAAVHPPLVRTSAYALSETLYFTLAWLCVLLLGAAIDRRSPAPPGRAAGLMFAAGVVGGLATLTRPAMIVFLGLASLWLALRQPRRFALSFLIASAVVIAPWTARNIREYGRFVLVASEGGITFWTGNHPLAIGEGDMAANPAIKLANREFRLGHPGASPEELEPIYYREALHYMAAHPIWWAGLVARKLFYLFVPIGPSYTLHSPLFQLASVLPYLVLLPFAIAGARELVRTRVPIAALLLLFSSTVLASMIFLPQERFRVPVIDPTLIVCAAVWAGSRRSRGVAAGRRD